MSKAKVVVLAGPTGTGESAITNEITRQFPKFQRLITATSREPRGEEKNEINYYFFSKEEFEREISKGNIAEYTYVKNRDVYYGTYKPELETKLQQGINIICNLDLVGAKYYKENYGATTIFIEPDSLENLKKRIQKRDPQISHEELNKRILNAQEEMEKEGPHYEYHVINAEGKMEEAVKEIIEILKKEGYEFA